MIIDEIISREVFDSRGNPTVETEVTTVERVMGKAIVPSGASTGIHEAIELRDKDEKRLKGKGVLKAVANVNKIIAPVLIGKDVTNQREIDETMLKLDGTKNKSKLGANAILSVSLAVAKAAAQSTYLPLYKYIGGPVANLLPVPFMNVINGGLHAKNKLDIQEFMIAPIGGKTFKESFVMGVETFHSLKEILGKKDYSTNVGDEGGFAPEINSTEEALQILISAIKNAGYKPGKDIALALDAAASSFYDEKNNLYDFAGEKKKRKIEEMLKFYEDLIAKFPLISIEDPLAEDDWDGWKNLTAKLGNKVQIVGDDIFVTNNERLSKGINLNIANAILIKVNQIGTLTETIDVVNLAKRNKYKAMISHRSGETEDTTIADLSVALGTGQIKTGSASRTDRICKYNQLLRIEEELGKSARYKSG